MPFDRTSPRRARRVRLPQRESLVLNNAEGTTIAVDTGCLWVTMESDPRDVVLMPGMRFEIDRSGRTVIAAEDASRFRLLAGARPRHPAGAWLARHALRIAARWSARRARQMVPYY